MLAAVAAAVAASVPVAPADPVVLPPAGRSVEGRRIVAERRGRPDAPRRILVVGAVHGDEPGGRRVAGALLRAPVARGAQVVVVRDLNPDGSARGTRVNARGVDLNRNFPHRWRPGARGRHWPGPRAASEPETRYAMRLVRAVRPDVTVWLHQPYGIVVDTPGADRALLRAHSRRTGLPLRALPRYRGTVAGWQNARAPGTSAFVVELAAGTPSAATVRRHVAAIRALERAPQARGETQGTVPSVPGETEGTVPSVPRPVIEQTPIPYGATRRAQMRAYARRHYGLDRATLRRPRHVVEHFTATDTFAQAFGIFAANAPDPELRERPGVCTHFVVERDGTIHQLVPLRLMCRHVIGLNHVAIGIEHVGHSDAQVMGAPRQRRASLRLTRWLQHRHGIPTADVIGHAESLGSRFYLERVRAARGRTHSDFGPRTMRRYRRLLDAGEQPQPSPRAATSSGGWPAAASGASTSRSRSGR